MKQFSQIKENYPQIALERFDNANLWIKYVILQTKNYLKDTIVELGAGCGSFTSSYMNNFKDILLLDSDDMNIKSLTEKFNEKIQKNNCWNNNIFSYHYIDYNRPLCSGTLF